MLGVIAHGVRNEMTLYYAPPAAVAGSQTPWRKLLDVDQDVTSADVRGNDIYLLSHHGASRYKVLRTSLKQPDLAHPDVVVPHDRSHAPDLRFHLPWSGRSHEPSQSQEDGARNRTTRAVEEPWNLHLCWIHERAGGRGSSGLQGRSARG